MKTIVSINLGNFGSTGKIMFGISKAARLNGYITYQAYPNSEMVQSKTENDIIICSSFENLINRKLAYITGLNGCFSHIPTWIFLRKLDAIKPDIIHFHNLHNSYINIHMMFNYIKKHNIRVVWTLHDCWAFTGHCPHYTFVGCDRWTKGCGKCPQLSAYPPSLFDTTELLWKLKKKWFSGLENLTIVTPSEWLASQVKRSFLANYPIKVINNGIDLSVFKPTNSSFRNIHGIEGKIVVLGVAFGWGKRKGLDIFNYLANELDDRFQIVLVGTDNRVDAELHRCILSVHRTHNQRELAEIYSAADVFVNPTREDNFPTVNIEALACGTPVITFETGGSPETINDRCGCVVPVDNCTEMLREILKICEKKEIMSSECIKRAQELSMEDKFNEYISLYND